MAPLHAQVLDISTGRLRHPQPIQRKQADQRVLGGRPKTGGDQERAELVAVQGVACDCIQPRTADMRRRGMRQEILLHRVPVEPGDGAQPTGDRGAGLDVRSADGEQR